MVDAFGKKGAAGPSARQASPRPVGWNAASIIFVLLLFIILAAVMAYLYGLGQNGNGWNPFKGVGPGGVGNNTCTMSRECSGPWPGQGGPICISPRACICGPDVEYGGSSTCTCDCGGSTGGVCVDYSGTAAAGHECGLRGHACGMGPGLAEQAPLCCPGDVCVDGICTAPGSGWLGKCKIVEQ
jgi:hypothetical protein